MSDINGYPETCSECGERRTCNSFGECHQCEQAAWDKADEEEMQRRHIDDSVPAS